MHRHFTVNHGERNREMYVCPEIRNTVCPESHYFLNDVIIYVHVSQHVMYMFS